MKNRLYIILAIWVSISLIVPSSVFAKRPKKYTDLDIPAVEWNVPKFSEFTLSNDVAGLVVEDHEVPLVDFYISFPSPADPVDKVGLADMTCWALRNGASVNIPADSLNDIMEFKAAYLWIYAGQEQLEIGGFCLSEDLGFLLSLTEELIANPAYPEDKIALKRSTMLEQIRRRNDRPRGIAFRELYNLLYMDHPWGRETSEGSVNSITRDDILAYHQQVFQPKGVVFGVTGDVDAAEVEKIAEQYLSRIESSGVEIPPLPSEVEQSAPGVFYVKKDASQAFVTVGHLTVGYDDPRRHAATIMNYILGGSGFQSRLMTRIRINEGLAYSTWSSFSTPVPVVGRFMASASTKLDQAGRTLTLLNDVVREYQENGPTEEEFEKAKQAYVNSFVWKYEDSDDILSRLVYYKWRGLPLDTPQRDLEVYQALTLEEVRNAAKELLHPDNLVIVVVGDKEKMDRPLEDFGEVKELELAK